MNNHELTILAMQGLTEALQSEEGISENEGHLIMATKTADQGCGQDENCGKCKGYTA